MAKLRHIVYLLQMQDSRKADNFASSTLRLSLGEWIREQRGRWER